MSVTAESIAAAWIEKWRTPVEDHQAGSPDLDFDLPQQDPHLCLAAIMEVLSRIPSDPDDHHFQVLAAGPLEDVIAFHGEALLPELELHARRSPPFRLLLNGVWFNHASRSVQAHLSKFLGPRW